jgi:hypothetical protein
MAYLAVSQGYNGIGAIVIGTIDISSASLLQKNSHRLHRVQLEVTVNWHF